VAVPDPRIPEGNTIDLDPRSAVSIAIVVAILGAVVWLVGKVPHTLTGLVLAVLIALALEPIVKLVQRRFHFGRLGAVVTVLGGFLAILSVFAVLIAPRAADQFARLDRQAPKVVKDLGQLPLVGRPLRENKVPQKVERWIKDLPNRLSSDTAPLEELARSVADGFLAFFLTVLLAITLLLDAEQLRERVRRLIPPQRLPEAERLGGIAHRVVGRYVAGSLLVALCAGSAVLAFGLVLGIPLAPLAAVWVCLTNLVPQVGGLLGGVPFVLLGFSESPTTGVIAALLFVGYQLFENHVLGPLISGRAVRLSPPIVMATVLIGVSAAGVLGALIAVPLVGACKALFVELRGEAQARAPTPP
jgi:predicted PurR-regulated permease PerM